MIMSQLTDNLNSIASIKEDIRDAIEAKGVSMSGVSFASFPDKISEIPSGGGQKTEISLTDTIRSNGVRSYTPPVGSVYSSVQITVNTGVPDPADNEIYYVTYSGNVLDSLFSQSDFGANLLSNTRHSSGRYCILTFDNPVLRTGDHSFYGKVQLKEIYLPSTVTRISNGSFYESGLQKIRMTNNVTVIEQDAFGGCFALITPFEISPACTTIGDDAFVDCQALFRYDIPDTVTSLGSGVFQSDSNLRDVYVYATTPPVMSLSPDQMYTQFEGCSGSLTIVVPAASLSAYQSAPGWSTYASRIVAQS